MNTSLIAAMVLALGSAGQALADGSCPSRTADVGAKSFRERTHDFCEVKWGAIMGTPAAAGQTHDRYINVCARRCYGDLGQLTAGKSLTALTGLSGIASASYVASLSDKANRSPASP